MYKFFRFSFLAAIFAVAMFSCKKDKVSISGLDLKELDNVKMKVGETVTKTAKVTPANYNAKPDEFSITSSNTGVATVTGNIQGSAITVSVTGVTPGQSTIAIKHTSGLQESRVVTVEPISGNLTVTVTGTYSYTGAAIVPPATNVTVKLGDATLAATNYTLAYSNNTNVGTATVTATATGNYSGTGSGTFTISPNATALTVTVTGEYTYNAAAIEPPAENVTVKAGDATLAATHYTLAYSNNTNVGTATVTATGTGNYSGTGSGTFTISPNTMTLTVTVTGDYTYNAAAIVPPAANITVKAGDATLAAANYTLAYSANTNAGTATVTATGTGNYTGTGSGTFTIAKCPISVTANNMSKFVGENDPVLTYTSTPALFGFDGFTGALTREPGEALNTPYAITQGTLALSSNYTINFTAGVFTIYPLFSGTGTSANDPYIIDTPERLARLATYVSAGTAPYANAGMYYKLTENISLSAYGAAFNLGRGWIPIGTDNNRPFKGHFDGNGKIVSGLYINNTTVDYAGLFGYINSGGSVKNLGVEGVVTGSNNVGGLASRIMDRASISNCYSSVKVTGNNYVGGLVAYIYDTRTPETADCASVSNCYTTGAVSGNTSVGGLVGEMNRGRITNCYATGLVTGTITGNRYVGGVAGSLVQIPRIANCAALNPSVTGSGSIGRVSANNDGSQLTNNVAWEGMTLNGVTVNTGAANGNNHGADITATQAKTQSTYVGLGWQFGNSDAAPWRIVGAFPLPIFYWQTSAPTADITHLGN